MVGIGTSREVGPNCGPKNAGEGTLVMSVMFRIAATSSLVMATFMGGVGLSAPPASAEKCLNSPQRGTYDGYFYSFWTDGGGSTSFCLQPDGRYTSQWSNASSWVGGIGWPTGGPRTVTYSATLDSAGGHSYVALYGWTTSPVIEYYVVDRWDYYRPPNGEGFMGTVDSDGGTYDIYRTKRMNAPSIVEGTNRFDQFWSVRRQKRDAGTITAGNHFEAWAAYGMKLGDHSYQVLATEGSNNSGSSDVTIDVGDSS
jgi:endo-1,4-beta-xylanase